MLKGIEVIIEQNKRIIEQNKRIIEQNSDVLTKLAHFEEVQNKASGDKVFRRDSNFTKLASMKDTEQSFDCLTNQENPQINNLTHFYESDRSGRRIIPKSIDCNPPRNSYRISLALTPINPVDTKLNKASQTHNTLTNSTGFKAYNSKEFLRKS